MGEVNTYTEAEAHRHFAASANGKVWGLLEKADRSQAEDDRHPCRLIDTRLDQRELAYEPRQGRYPGQTAGGEREEQRHNGCCVGESVDPPERRGAGPMLNEAAGQEESCLDRDLVHPCRVTEAALAPQGD